MKKRVLSMVISLVLILSVFSAFTFAGAAQPEKSVSAYCIGSHEDDGPSWIEVITLKILVYSANQEIDRLVRNAKRTPWDDVDTMLVRIDAVVARVMRYADSIGATVECIYEYEVIDGRTVAIDPLRVVNF